jgi:hypothetical protein
VANSPWHIGNTTVRNPYRLKDGLRALARSPLIGNLDSKRSEFSFAELLHESEVVHVARIESGKGEDYSDLGRKWRSALDKMGFITPKPTRNLKTGAIDPRLQEAVTDFPILTGRPYELTPQGERLARAGTLPEEQDCFLRAMLAYQLSSDDPEFTEPFNPLRVTLRVINELGKLGADAAVNNEEVAAVVQFVKSERAAERAAKAIIKYRSDRKHAKNKNAFDRQWRSLITKEVVDKRLRTFGDYADSNMRYLRITGLFSLKGRGIQFAPTREALINQILSSPFTPRDEVSYLKALWQGAELPTDREPEARITINSLAAALRTRGEQIVLPNLLPLDVRDLTHIRFGLEQQLETLQEKEFADKQASEWQDILEYIDHLSGLKGSKRRVPDSEGPAYLEWSIWRAFLAIDSLTNKPSEARRFQVDQDFLPIRTAPGNGPDMIFEFNDFVLVVEVTLSRASRQEAMEGEPVRRHVARVIEEYEQAGKEVFGLFIAVDVDTNTAETFRIGSWYKRDDTRLTLSIVPMRLEQFARVFKTGFSRGVLRPEEVKRVLRSCLDRREAEAPIWKRLIEDEVATFTRGSSFSGGLLEAQQS